MSLDLDHAEPRSQGFDPEALRELGRIFDSQLEGGLHYGAGLALMRNGVPVFHRVGGFLDARSSRPVLPSSPFIVFSATKAFIAVLVHRLADRGLVDLEAPLARYWPEFAARGKAEITVADLLSHRAGLQKEAGILDLLSWGDPAASGRRVARLRPTAPAGAAPVYHSFTAHIALGELLRRIEGRDPARCLEEDLLEPLGMADSSAGLSRERRRVASGIYTADPRQRGPAWTFSLPFMRSLFMPAASLNTSARDLARFYDVLVRDAVSGEGRLLSRTAIERALTAAYDGPDGRSGRRMRWSLGFSLGGVSPFPGEEIHMMGRDADELSFGHAGQGGCALGWADRRTGLAFGFVCNRFLPGADAHRRFQELSDAARAALGSAG